MRWWCLGVVMGVACATGGATVEPEGMRPAVQPVAPDVAADVRLLRLQMRVTVPPHPAAPLDVWLPLPRDKAEGQVVRALQVDGAVGERMREAAHGNEIWHARLEPSEEPLQLTLTADVERRAITADLQRAEARSLTPDELQTHAAHLAADARVPVGADDEVLAPIVADIRARAGSTHAPVLARTIYDHVIDTMEYKKVGTGWGQGDTYWACSEKYGNCTDFHSLYLSLARTERIPARFEMGFPVPLDRTEGRLAGYHCWIQFWLPGVGWVPLDASEADKHPELRDALYGGFPADRVLFTIGRDLRLGPNHRGPALNYFIAPYAEADGQPVELTHEVRYETLTP